MFKNQIILESLFMAHPSSISLAQRFHHIAILDSTYKTKYSLPLLQIVGITSSQKTFTVGLALLAREVDSYSMWALECLNKLVWKGGMVPKVFITDRDKAVANEIARVFPNAAHHLCSWHIENNVISECKKFFAEGESEAWTEFMRKWRAVIFSPTVDDYANNVAQLRKSLEDRGRVKDYLELNILP